MSAKLVERIKIIAQQHNLNLKETAIKAGIGENSIYRWKSQSPTTESLTKVAKVLGVTTDYLLGNEEHGNKHVDLKKDPVVLSYGGKPVSKEDMDIIKAILERHRNDEK